MSNFAIVHKAGWPVKQSGRYPCFSEPGPGYGVMAQQGK